MPPRGHVRVRENGAGTGFHVTIPAQLGRMIGTDRLFRVELVEEGILLRAIEEGEPLRVTLPPWLVEGSAATEGDSNGD